MVYYVKQGKVPHTRHTYDLREKIPREELFGEESFEGSYSLLYHKNEPTRIQSIREEKKKLPDYEIAKMHKLINTNKIERKGDFISSRTPLFMNDVLIISVSRPSREMDYIFRHGTRDQLIFVHKGEGVLRSLLGDIEYGEGDYIYIPKGTSYYIEYGSATDFLLIESRDNIGLPQRYLNRYGQIKEGAPYYSRDIRHPVLGGVEHEKRNYKVRVDFDDRFVVENRDYHPFDLEGWDGYHFPFAINIRDMMPIVGKIHQPPPVHETFTAKSFMIGTFLPRKFDFHERAIPISYYHSNVDSDEILYYSSGNFMSRKGVREGSITLHVRGMIHGPQPGTIENAIGKGGTDETAVMVESYVPLGITGFAGKLEDKDYMKSWYL
jgi:homogentisate 1,2-dioxygenase